MGVLQCALMVLLCASCATSPQRSEPQAHGSAFHDEKLAEIDRAIETAIQEKRMPGAVFWLERNGANHRKVYGKRALTPNEETMTEDTIFDAASLTKVIACTPAVMLLIERSQIRLDDPVVKFVPEFKGDGKETVTVKQLLTHTSGLRPDVSTQPAWSGYDTAIRLACAERLQAKPGTVFRYSDINFFLLGHIVQQVTRQKLETFVAREVYQPLKMRDSGYLPVAALRSRIAPTQLTDNQMLRGTVHDPTARYMGGVAGHAGLFTTAHDLARFARMMLNEGELDGVRVFKPETVRLMTRVQTPDGMTARRGLGWDVDTGYSRRGRVFPIGSYGHTGFTGTCIWIDPFSKTFWILLTNRVHPDGRGNILPLQSQVSTLSAQAIKGFNFSYVPGAIYASAAETNSTRSSVSSSPRASALNGIDVLIKNQFAPLRGLRIGLITNHTGQDKDRNATIDILHRAPGVKLVALFSPEHGIRGALDEKVNDSVDEKTGLPVYSLYGERRTPATNQLSGLDALVFDIQDIGCRFYTYPSTMGNCMEASAKAGLKFFVLDRVNPITGSAASVEGPVLQGKTTFVGYHTMPLRHGLTIGEFATLLKMERFTNANLTVVKVENWKRDEWYDQTGLPWTNPSPNMRSLAEATLYPGVGLLESALAVGRGTDTPFEVVGAPYADDIKLAAELNAAMLPGVRFIPVRFTPKASTFKDKPCRGVNILVTDRDRFNAVDCGITLALKFQQLYPRDFALDKISHLLFHPPTEAAIKAGKSLQDIHALWAKDLEEFNKRREKCLLYQ